jgi:hypothetical protein
MYRMAHPPTAPDLDNSQTKRSYCVVLLPKKNQYPVVVQEEQPIASENQLLKDLCSTINESWQRLITPRKCLFHLLISSLKFPS